LTRVKGSVKSSACDMVAGREAGGCGEASGR
jgi:hypothetical protein